MFVFCLLVGCIANNQLEERQSNPTIPKTVDEQTCVEIAGETLGTGTPNVAGVSHVKIRNNCGDIAEGVIEYIGYDAEGNLAKGIAGSFVQPFLLERSEEKVVDVILPLSWFGKGSCTDCVASYDIKTRVDKIGVDQYRTIKSRYSNQSLQIDKSPAENLVKPGCNNWECTKRSHNCIWYDTGNIATLSAELDCSSSLSYDNIVFYSDGKQNTWNCLKRKLMILQMN